MDFKEYLFAQIHNAGVGGSSPPITTIFLRLQDISIKSKPKLKIPNK